ncbi:MAG TPA: methyltransferase domain-containing protein [Candidatus Sericytochromatia bacterium]|jgi:2-polyprenyl-3-methyl-5-hydroxy-6-metoxy-1,4-benzoquinol methylase
MNKDLAYKNYWERKELVNSKTPKFTQLKWWNTKSICELDNKVLSEIKDKSAVLDVGAGNLRLMHKFQQAGYLGEYHTQDVGEEFTYTYETLQEINRKYPAILCFDVIEHLQLSDGLELIHNLVDLLEPNGVMIIHTPNARSIRDILYWDMTHLHAYNIIDLWAYLTCLDLQVDGYRVIFTSEHRNWMQSISTLASQYITSRILGVDFADGILLIAKKQKFDK